MVSRLPRALTVLTSHDYGTMTVLPIVTGDAEPTVLVFDGDWTGSQDVLVAVAVVTGLALRSVRNSRPDPRPAGLLRHTRRLVRSLRTAHGLEASMRLVADHAAAMLNAERVSVWLFNNEDHALRIAAARGVETTAALKHVRITPGERVIGQVYQSGRALFVNDVRELPSHEATRRYRTNAFACVPIREHGVTRGVLSITDKRDGASFDKIDRIAMRTLGSFGGTVLAAASSSAEIARLAEAASVDAVTGLLNRSSLDSRLRQEVARANREHGKLAVLIADLDDFKNVNDNYGHQSGDALLSRVGSIIRSSVRTFDICARYGGDEFVVVMPNADEASAMACAERILATMPKEKDGDHRAISMSIGLTTSVPNDDPGALIRRADQALYEAKFAGKNGVRVSRAGDASASAALGEPFRPGSVASADLRLSYVLVADRDLERRTFYQHLSARFRLGLLIAHDRDQAAQIIQQFGPPALLVLDLTSTVMDGLSLIDSLPVDPLPTTKQSTMVLAISESRQLCEFAAVRTTSPPIDVINPQVTKEVLRARIEAAFLKSEGVQLPASRRAEDLGRHTIAPSRHRTETRPSAAAVSSELQAGVKEPLWEPELMERERGESEVARELARVRRERRQLSIVLFEISSDRKRDAIARPAMTDLDVLDSVADTLIRAIRPTDLPIRWGGSEFLLVLPGLAVGPAKIVAERIRAAMHARGTDRVAIAGGVAQLAQHEQFGDVIARAREQLSVAHGLGHNRISFSPVH
jgi:diguanylate cyclase (GGDEF)-like protein